VSKIQRVVRTAVGIYDSTSIDRTYIIVNDDLSWIYSKINTGIGHAFIPDPSRFLKGAISSIEFSEQLNEPGKCNITVYLSQDNPEKALSIYNQLVDDIIYKLDIIIYIQTIDRVDGKNKTINEKRLRYKLIDAQLIRNLPNDTGFVLNCAHWMSIFKDIPVAHITDISGSSMMSFFSTESVDIISRNLNNRLDIGSFVPRIQTGISNYTDIIEREIKGLIQVGNPGNIAKILEITFANIVATTAGIEVETKTTPPFDKYSLKKEIQELAIQYKKTTQKLIASEFMPFILNLKKQLQGFNLIKVDIIEAEYQEIYEGLSKVVVNIIQGSTWYDAMSSLLGLFGFNLLFKTDYDYPTVIKNEPFYNPLAISVDDVATSSSIKMVTTLPFTRIRIVPPANIYNDIANTGAGTSQYSITIPEINKKDSTSGIQEKNFGLKIYQTGVNKWISYLLLLHLKKFDNKTEENDRLKQANKNMDYYYTNYAKVEEYKLLEQRINIDHKAAKSVEIGKGVDGISVADMVIKGNIIEVEKELKARGTTLRGEKGDDSIERINSVWANIALNDDYAQEVYSAYREYNTDTLTMYKASIDKLNLEHEALTKKLIITANRKSVADTSIKLISNFLYYLNSYNGSTASFTIPTFYDNFELGDVVKLSKYSGKVISKSHSITADGTVLISVQLKFVVPSENINKSELKNPMFVYTDVTQILNIIKRLSFTDLF